MDHLVHNPILRDITFYNFLLREKREIHVYLELLPLNWWTWAPIFLKSTPGCSLFSENRKGKTPNEQQNWSFQKQSMNRKSIQNPNEKKTDWKGKILGSLQSSGDLIEKLLRIIKEKRYNFHNKIWVAVILKLLKLQKLPIQKPLPPDQTESRTQQKRANPIQSKTQQKQNKTKPIWKLIINFKHFMFLYLQKQGLSVVNPLSLHLTHLHVFGCVPPYTDRPGSRKKLVPWRNYRSWRGIIAPNNKLNEWV